MGLAIDLLENSFAALKPKTEQLATTFYETLFERHPEVRPLFEGVDLEAQQRKLVQALAFAVANLRKPQALAEALGDLGARHVGYGVTDDQYPAVGECLLVALETTAGPAWNDELKQAWTEAYGALAEMAIAGAAKRRAEG